MIVRIQAAGGSFLGAGKYYLHDKLAAGDRIAVKDQGDERVWFTDTRNTLNTDPARALDEMWRTAEDQTYLKMQAGVKRGGRVCEDPVKTLSLSWHKDDKPTPEHMIESADAYLKHMGWDAHQALFVGHNDTEHRHIHIILNRVDPANGRTLDDYREQKRSQVWALAYEKTHEQLRCEERELRAAKREGRAPEIEQRQASQQTNKQAEPCADDVRPANDHLPHNVIMLTRPLEKQFENDEQKRCGELQSRDRDTLKAEQRAEREAFFKDGAKQFKALRLAIYDEVRKGYAPEWRTLYQDAKVAEHSAEAWSKSAVTRSLYFAKDGKWDDARSAFADRDSIHDATAASLAERKSDLKTHQHEDLRERQTAACDALRESRDLQYQELLQRQREQRGAFAAGVTLEALGMSRDAGPAKENTTAIDHLANENRPTPDEHSRNTGDGGNARLAGGNPRIADSIAPAGSSEQAVVSSGIDIAVTPEGVQTAPVLGPALEAPEVTRQISDLAAGGIGQAASYLADQLGELFAPTPPEIRKARAKADAKHDAEKPAVPVKTDPYAKLIDAAVRTIEEERAAKGDIFWKERDRGKGWERDQ